MLKQTMDILNFLYKIIFYYFSRKITTLKKPSKHTKKESRFSNGLMSMIFGILISPSSWTDTRGAKLKGPGIYSNR